MSKAVLYDMENRIGIFWLREDFRLERNNALAYATQNHYKVTTIYLYKKKLFENRQAQRWWLFKSLENFKIILDKKNINLEIIEIENFHEGFKTILNKKNFSIYWNKIYEPNYLSFDQQISKILIDRNIEHKIFKGNLLNEAEEIKKKDGTPFKVFTPFWREAEKHYINKDNYNKSIIKSKSSKIIFLKDSLKIHNILPKIKWYPKFEKYWKPSEKAALSIVKEFIKCEISDYGSNRDIPGIKGTSKISPYLAFGQIHVETIWEETQKIEKKGKGYRKYINELGWREFSHSLINYFPQMLKENLRKEFDKFPWQNNKKHLTAWKQGLTGYPIVDAGMRELYETGWMHNRVRMITASFLVKHLRINWKEGEIFFRDSLVDFNEANNIAGWQWVAGCGADAAPYFRIFNPILQGEKFDPIGNYVKKWVPELISVPKEFLHKPWELDSSINGFEIGKSYPKPIVTHEEARYEALKAFKSIKK